MKLLLVFLVSLKIVNGHFGDDVRSGFFTGNRERNVFLRAFRKSTTLRNREESRATEEIYTVQIGDADSEETGSPASQVSEISSNEDLQKHLEKSLKKTHLFKSTPEPPPCANSGQAFVCPNCHIQFLVNLGFEKIKDKN